MDQQGSPPGRSARSPGSGRSGRDDEAGRDWRAARQQERLQRRERAASWRDDEAFAPPADDQLPPWAGPAVYPQRPAGTPRRHPPEPGDYPPSQGRHGGAPPAPADYQQPDYQPHDYPAGGATATTPGYRPTHGQHAEAGYQDQDSYLAHEELGAEPAMTAADRVPAQGDYGYADDADAGSELGAGVHQDEPEDEIPPTGRRRGRRAAAARLRRSRRRVYTYCGTAIVIVLLIAGGVWIHGLMQHPKPRGNLVTSLQPGEYSAVPSSCGSIGTALLSQYLAPSGRSITRPLTSSTDSECTFTVDSKPVFRVLDVTVQAFQPSALASGNGAATENAIGNYDVALQNLAHPVKNSGQPAATITTLKRIGQRGFSALRVDRSGKVVTDLVTVNVQLRNVLITITLQGQESGDGFGPVSIKDLQAGALAAARQVLAKVAAQSAIH